jgi:sulfite reductase subunit B
MHQLIQQPQLTRHGSSLYVPEACLIERVEPLNDAVKHFQLRYPNGRDLGHEPGQFVEVSVFGVGEAPFGVSSSPTVSGSFDLGIRKAGAVTSAIHELKAGDFLWVRGPFGRGFDLTQLRGSHILAVAGGIGIVPLRSIINYVVDRPDEFESLTILYGSRNPSEVLGYPDLKRWAASDKVHFQMIVDKADDTWDGPEGLITTLIPPLDIDPDNTHALIVGPPVMFRFVIGELAKKGLSESKVVVSLERMMKCGVGKCGHCAIGDLYCCTDGPVFTYSEIKKNPEALS